ncbi:CFI-box-CTERM domain-containing protein [Clostridium sp. DJ247]|uniref:CFI-box-CTERM domain-containing protein n=1 Tax=Clostridium sp. DJ247 TaxID=2726188 RepID=UPI0016241C65|nr:CFI-box-CTERM domain-containing protein [Clostridium sp. DJ247]MBC2581349.1 hypothetical protein [Clostridium sp. DJ247]
MSQCQFLREEKGDYYCDADKSSKRGLSDMDYVNKFCFDKHKFKSCRLYKRVLKGEDECFLTTACVKSKGLDDNCYELTCLRKFRDEYLMKDNFGSNEVKKYYSIAPKIIENIDRLPNSNLIYNDIYENLILKCISLIEKDENEDAFRLYKKTIEKLEKEYM